LAWMAQRLVSSKRPTRYASEAFCRARIAEDWKRRSVLLVLGPCGYCLPRKKIEVWKDDLAHQPLAGGVACVAEDAGGR